MTSIYIVYMHILILTCVFYTKETRGVGITLDYHHTDTGKQHLTAVSNTASSIRQQLVSKQQHHTF